MNLIKKLFRKNTNKQQIKVGGFDIDDKPQQKPEPVEELAQVDTTTVEPKKVEPVAKKKPGRPKKAAAKTTPAKKTPAKKTPSKKN